MEYDIMIIGCGPAGMTAAIYGARAGKTVMILDHEGVGGQMGKSPHIENFPGHATAPGADIAFDMFAQVTELGVDLEIDEITGLYATDRGFTISTSTTVYVSKTVIIATGAHPIELSVPGGAEYNGNGIYYCVACDGPLFKDRSVLVVGSGNSGAQYALELNTYCSDVTICDVTRNLCCEKMMADKILASHISVKLSANIQSITKTESDQMCAHFEDGSEIIVDGIFVAIGQKPSTDFVQNLLKLDNRGYIVSADMLTDVPGIFVAGDCRTKMIRQAITAASDGAEAALKAVRYLNNHEQGVNV